MKRVTLALVPVALLLTGCAAAAPASDEARENCVTAYEELPAWIETLSEQSGEPATAETPCDNWIDSQGEDEFVEFWTDPAEFIPYVISVGKLENG